jgi:hypothetical protein
LKRCCVFSREYNKSTTLQQHNSSIANYAIIAKLNKYVVISSGVNKSYL